MIILDPIKSLLFSRKFILALVSVIVSGIIYFVPSLEAVASELVTLIGAVALTVILGIAIEDAAEKSRNVTPVTTVENEVEDLIKSVIERYRGVEYDKPAE